MHAEVGVASSKTEAPLVLPPSAMGTPASTLVPYSTYYPPIPFFEQELLWRVFTYIVSAHPVLAS